ncbi:MAG: heat-inducible transcriptional repressor HrcA [Chloroflexota bacterium]
MHLTQRQERILKSVVDIYTETARPVGSEAILGVVEFKLSSATIRNELSILEDAGYLRQLHTSGGRVPTNAGYQYYVERLMDSSRVPDSDAHTIRHQFHQAHPEVQEWLKLAATIMASRMHNVGLITAPKSSDIRLRHVQLISIQNRVALLIVVLQDGSVLQEMVTLSTPASQEDLSNLSTRLNAELQGLTSSAAEAKLPALSRFDDIIAPVVAHLLRRSKEQHTQVFHAGLAEMIRQPEFLGPRRGESAALLNHRLGQMVEFLHQGFAVERLLSGWSTATHVQVVIGGDAAGEGLQDYSFVLGRYGDADDSSGYLGIIGPTRMEYPRAIALVRYMSDLMTDLMQAY